MSAEREILTWETFGVASRDLAQMVADGKSVTYRFADAWALVRMIQRQREPDAAGRADGRSQLLRLEFPLILNADNPRAVPQEVRARVYMRLALSPVGKRTPGFWEQWMERINRLEPIGNVDYAPSEVTLLDLFSPKWLKEHEEAGVQTIEVHRVL